MFMHRHAFSGDRLSYYERERILGWFSVGSLLDDAKVHAVRAEIIPRTLTNDRTTIARELLVADGNIIMEMDGKPTTILADNIFNISPLLDTSIFYKDYNRLLPYHLRHNMPKHAPLPYEQITIKNDKGEDQQTFDGSFHLVRATLSELGGSSWQQELMLQNGRRVISAEGQGIVNGFAAGKEICGYKVIECAPLQPSASIHYRNLEEYRHAA